MKSLNCLAMAIASASMLWMGCSKEAALDVPLAPAKDLPENTPLEQEIKKLYDAHGVRFEYEWDRNAFARNVVADPPRIDDVLPYIEVFDVLFFEALEKVSPQFVQKESPITVFLLGSGINYGGSAAFGESTAGQAGNIQPNRLTLGGLNEFGRLIRDNSSGADDRFLDYIYNRSIGTFPDEGGEVGFIYHEWAHFIDSKHDIPLGFEQPSFDNYLRGTNAYRKVSDSEARVRGFMLPYGMQNEAEDFATYVQIMVWQPRTEIEQDFLRSGAAETKYELVNDYFEGLGLNIFQLRDSLHAPTTKLKLLDIKHKYDESQ